jgi:hypothetical protein
MPTRILVRVPKPEAAAAAPLDHHETVQENSNTKVDNDNVDEFGLLINNKPPKKRATEKRTLQPPMEPPTPTAHNEDEVSSPPKKRARQSCSFEGCTNGTKIGGVCFRHGAKEELIVRKLCSFDGCSNIAQKRGVCWRTSKRIDEEVLQL